MIYLNMTDSVSSGVSGVGTILMISSTMSSGKMDRDNFLFLECSVFAGGWKTK